MRFISWQKNLASSRRNRVFVETLIFSWNSRKKPNFRSETKCSFRILKAWKRVISSTTQFQKIVPKIIFYLPFMVKEEKKRKSCILKTLWQHIWRLFLIVSEKICKEKKNLYFKLSTMVFHSVIQHAQVDSMSCISFCISIFFFCFD